MRALTPSGRDRVNAPARHPRPASGWFNRFLVLPDDDHHLHNNGKPIDPGEHDDVHCFPSKDAAETFAIAQLKRHAPELRALIVWLGAHPNDERVQR